VFEAAAATPEARDVPFLPLLWSRLSLVLLSELSVVDMLRLSLFELRMLWSRESLVLFELFVLWLRESLVLFELFVLRLLLSLPESRFVVLVVVLVRVLVRVVLLSLFDEFMLLLLRSLLSAFEVLPLLLVLLLLLSLALVVLVVVLVLRLLLSCVLLLLLSLVLFDEFMLLLVRVLLSFALLVFVLLLLLSFCEEFMLLLLRSLLSVEVLVVVMLRFDVTVLPPRAVMSSAAEALSEKASEMAVTSKVLFIRFPLWVLVGDRSAVAPTLLSIAQPMPAT
jgi:hypothetical protein